MDYYSILGVPKNASEKDLKKAYKKASMQHHPDRGGDGETFKQINEAYSTLKDPVKRQQYDNPQPQYNFNTGNMQGHPFEDMFSGFGFGAQRGRQRRNSDVTIGLNLDLKDVLTGKNLTTRYRLADNRIKEADIDIPIGVPDGIAIQFRGLGDDTIPGVPPGDLIVRIKIKNPPGWSRTGNDLKTSVFITIFDCLLGGSVELVTLDGKRIRITIPRGTQPGAVFNVAGHGIRDMQLGHRGNLFVEIKPVVPNIKNEIILQDIERIKNALN